MLGISFKGRYNRKKYWITTILATLIFLGVSVLLVSSTDKLNQHEIQVFLAKNIIREKGSIAHDDLEKTKESIEHSNRTDAKTKLMLEKNITEMESMPDAKLQSIAKEDVSINEILVLCLHVVLSIYFTVLIFSFQVKRTHDLNKSGWLTFFMGIIPIVNIFFGLYIAFFKGDATDNKYGPPPGKSKK